jgi:F-type H+-transporting ATPase subunit epsilon
MPAFFSFEVHTPYRLFFRGEVESIVLTLEDGEIGVYAHRSPFTAPVISCVLHIKDNNGKQRHAFITEGILEVKEHKNVLMVDAAEWPEEIDIERAKAARQTTQETLAETVLKFEADSLRVKLRRAECRIKAWDAMNEHRV